MATRDKGVTPGIVARNFQGSDWASEGQILSREKISPAQLDYRKNQVSWVDFKAERAAALAALEKMQAERPLKPPGRR